MRIKVWDIEDNKERTLEKCVTPLCEVGAVLKVQVNSGNETAVHHFKVLEILPDSI